MYKSAHLLLCQGNVFAVFAATTHGHMNTVSLAVDTIMSFKGVEVVC